MQDKKSIKKWNNIFVWKLFIEWERELKIYCKRVEIRRVKNKGR